MMKLWGWYGDEYYVVNWIKKKDIWSRAKCKGISNVTVNICECCYRSIHIHYHDVNAYSFLVHFFVHVLIFSFGLFLCFSFWSVCFVLGSFSFAYLSLFHFGSFFSTSIWLPCHPSNFFFSVLWPTVGLPPSSSVPVNLDEEWRR